MNKKEKEMDKRSRIMAATEEVFSRRGYAQATIDEIIALADTGKGTVYKYFGSKDDLFYTLVSQKHCELMEQMQRVSDAAGKGIEEKTGRYSYGMDPFFAEKHRALAGIMF